MTVKVLLTGAVALSLLAGCGGPRGDWRAEVGRTTPNPVVLDPQPPLVIPPRLDLPPPL